MRIDVTCTLTNIVRKGKEGQHTQTLDHSIIRLYYQDVPGRFITRGSEPLNPNRRLILPHTRFSLVSSSSSSSPPRIIATKP
ncbi:hypothetical protein L1987_05107 [Smallanthus sonchifolius]|uniref:Uncharacterized protein n=1 Tax=Smallanthus sonchifolius TaxID=185202 RepID=A0ACB9JUM1_9ASTR|nr:hypothetical protein L1987_05107 [Smallanthus sonchifolius]